MPEPVLTPQERATLRRNRARIEALIAPSEHGGGIDPRAAEALSDQDLVNALAQYLDLEPIEKQALLEQSGVSARATSLIELLEMKTLIARHSSVPPLPN